MTNRPATGESRRRVATPRRLVWVLLLLLGLAISGVVAGPWSSPIRNTPSPTPAAGSVTDSSLTSWNPHVSCSAELVTIRDVLGPAYPSQTVNGSRYQTNSTAGGIPQDRALSPPCTITNRTGQVMSSFVQINGVSLYGYGVKTTDCSGWYSKQNGGGRYPGNQTFCTNAGQIITIGTKSGYMKVEIDRDWLGKGYCGVGVPYCDNATLGQYQSNGSISLDVQGFVFWEGPWHWELHPLTGWKLSAPPTPPSAPQNLVATGGNAQVTLGWQAPTSDGGSVITNYKVYRGLSPGGESLLTTVGNVLTYTDASVTNGVTYYYQVTAVNGPGEGVKSNEASATPNAPPPPPSPPFAPRNLVATAGNAQVTLTWQAPASDGGSVITDYRMYRGATSGSEALLATMGVVASYTDTAVTNGQTYYYQVTATNGAGESPRSNEVSTTPTPPPPPPPPDFGLSASPSSLSIHLASAGTSTITLASLNGFTGTVSLSASVACSSFCIFSPTASLSPTSLTVAAGGTGTSTLTISTALWTTPGAYTIAITATSGSITHTITVTVQVTL